MGLGRRALTGMFFEAGSVVLVLVWPVTPCLAVNIGAASASAGQTRVRSGGNNRLRHLWNECLYAGFFASLTGWKDGFAARFFDRFYKKHFHMLCWV